MDGAKTKRLVGTVKSIGSDSVAMTIETAPHQTHYHKDYKRDEVLQEQKGVELERDESG